jgi:hypothetical protein
MGSAVPDRLTAKVPEEVMVDGVTERNAGSVRPTEVTVPPPPVAAIEIDPLPLVTEMPEPAVMVALDNPPVAELPMSN